MKAYCRECGYEVEIGALSSRVYCPDCKVEMERENRRLIRCQDCKWCDNVGKKRALICTNPYIDVDPHPDFFCGYAERRIDGNSKEN